MSMKNIGIIVAMDEEREEIINLMKNTEVKQVYNLRFIKGTIEGKQYELNDKNFPTIDKNYPYALTLEEKEVMERLTESFVHSPSLQKHLKYLYTKGEMYTIFNKNLLFHGCIPTDENGDLKEVEFMGKRLIGKAYFDEINDVVNKVFASKEPELVDIMWYLWISPDSPFFGKEKMATFESYFVKDKTMSNLSLLIALI